MKLFQFVYQYFFWIFSAHNTDNHGCFGGYILVVKFSSSLDVFHVSAAKLPWMWLAGFEQCSLNSSDCWHGRLNSYKGTALITWMMAKRFISNALHAGFTCPCLVFNHTCLLLCVQKAACSNLLFRMPKTNLCWCEGCFLVAQRGSVDVCGLKVVLCLSRSDGQPLWSRLKYLNNFLMDWFAIWCRHYASLAFPLAPSSG